MTRGHDAGLAVFGPATLDDLVAAVETHPEFGAALRSNRDWAVIHEYSIRFQIVSASELLDDVEAALEGS